MKQWYDYVMITMVMITNVAFRQGCPLLSRYCGQRLFLEKLQMKAILSSCLAEIFRRITVES